MNNQSQDIFDHMIAVEYTDGDEYRTIDPDSPLYFGEPSYLADLIYQTAGDATATIDDEIIALRDEIDFAYSGVEVAPLQERLDELHELKKLIEAEVASFIKILFVCSRL